MTDHPGLTEQCLSDHPRKAELERLQLRQQAWQACVLAAEGDAIDRQALQESIDYCSSKAVGDLLTSVIEQCAALGAADEVREKAVALKAAAAASMEAAVLKARSTNGHRPLTEAEMRGHCDNDVDDNEEALRVAFAARSAAAASSATQTFDISITPTFDISTPLASPANSRDSTPIELRSAIDRGRVLSAFPEWDAQADALLQQLGTTKKGYRMDDGARVGASTSSGRQRRSQNLQHAVAANREALVRQKSMSALELDLGRGPSTGSGLPRPPPVATPLPPPMETRHPLRVSKSLGLLSARPVVAQYSAKPNHGLHATRANWTDEVS